MRPQPCILRAARTCRLPRSQNSMMIHTSPMSSPLPALPTLGRCVWLSVELDGDLHRRSGNDTVSMASTQRKVWHKEAGGSTTRRTRGHPARAVHGAAGRYRRTQNK